MLSIVHLESAIASEEEVVLEEAGNATTNIDREQAAASLLRNTQINKYKKYICMVMQGRQALILT